MHNNIDKQTILSSNETNNPIEDVLTAGIFSHNYLKDTVAWEANNILSPLSENGKLFDDRIRKIACKLLPGRDFSQLSFVLSTSQQINAWYKASSSNISEHIAITLGMLGYCKTEDELVAVVAHELGHWYKRQKMGEGRNTRGEEMFSEIRLMGKMYDAGWNPTAIYDLINSLHTNALDVQIREIFDVHGLSKSMVTVAKNALVYTKQKKGGMPKNKPFSDNTEIQELGNYNSFYEVEKILPTSDIKSQFMILKQYVDTVLGNGIMSSDICEKIDTCINQKYVNGEITRNNIFDIFAKISLDQVDKFPLIVGIYEQLVGGISTPDDLVALTGSIPTAFRYDTKVSISIYKKLQTFSGISFLQSESKNSNFYDKLASLFSTNNNVMVIFELRKMFLKDIHSQIFYIGTPIMHIVSYAKNRSEIIEKVFAGEEIMSLILTGIKLGVISLDDIKMCIGYIAKNEHEKNMIQCLIDSMEPKVCVEIEPIKETSLRQIDSSEKEQKLYDACDKIELLPFDKVNDSKLFNNKKNRNVIKLLSYYNQLLELNQNNIDFVVDNIITYLEKESDPSFLRATWEALIMFVYNHKDILSEKNIDMLLHSLGLYNFVLDYHFGYMTFHHYLFTEEIYSGFLDEDEIEDGVLHKHDQETQIDEFFIKYKSLFDTLVFSESDTIGYKVKEIIAVAKNRKHMDAKTLTNILITTPYWRSPFCFEDMIGKDKSNIVFGLNRESFKKTLNRVFLKEQPEYQNLHSAVEFYLFLLKHDVLSQNKDSDIFILQKIVGYLEQSAPEVQYENIMKLLHHHTIDIPQIRIKIYEIFINAVKQIVKDKKSLPEVFNDVSKCALIDKYAIIETICSDLVTQESDSVYAKKSIYGGTINDKSINAIDSTIFKEQTGVVVMSQVDKKTAVIDYLLSDGDKDVIDALTLELLARDALNLLATFDDLGKTGNDLQKIIGDKSDLSKKISDLKENGDIEGYRNLLKMHRELAIANEMYTNIAKLYYQNYWSSPFWIRALLLDHLVNHESDLYDEESDFVQVRQKNIQKQKKVEEYIYKKIVDSILPQSATYGSSCKKIFDVYYSVLQKYEKTLFLSAIIAGSEKSSTLNSDEQLGVILAHILGSMGPAETKFGQALHSYPNTPKELSDGLYRLKSHAQVPPMWDIWDMIKNPAIIPSVISNDIVAINNIYAGSIHITIICENQKGDEVVLTIQRENALERINEGFSMISKVINKIGTDEQFTYLSNHASTILQEAKHITKNELDSNIMKEQYGIASNIYNGSEVTYNGMKVSFEVPKLLAYGNGYKFISYLPGSHFNDIATSTIVSNDVKKSFAKIILFKELLSDYQGLCTDKDRHGDNVRVDFDKMIIGNFDFGGMTLVAPTEGQKQLLGQITAHVYKAYGAEGTDPLSVFLNVVDAFIKDNPGEISFFATLQQRLLSLGDYFKILDKTDFQDVIIGVLSQNIDPVIKETIEKSVGLPLSLLAGMSKFSISHITPLDNPEPVYINPIKNEKKFDPLHDLL